NFIQQALRNEPLTIYGDGTQTRSFCYVDDLVEGVVRLLHSDVNSPVNIGNPEETTILEFAQKINNYVGNNAGVVYNPDSRGEGDPQRRRPDISRAQSLLNWQPKVAVEYGLDQTIPYFKAAIGLE
ncbi:MAG: GDP-mannose 4,6-dehydratase, partial [Anaerolineales bacterium]|nr:GDP-mannose 4,6-dehydratase [Anaerolineales bacterium]